MRKVIIINVLAIFVASAAFATSAATGSIDFTTGGKGLYGGKSGVTLAKGQAGTTLIGTTSTNVGVGWITGTGGYAINTQHLNGTKAFGTSYDSTAMYQKDVTKGTAVTQPSATDSSSFSSGWTTM
jgi:hypothetical protein